jgi:ribonuclease P protein subunit POP4
MRPINKKSQIRNKILNRSLIDLMTTIDQHSDPNLIGLSGRISEESKNMLILETTENKLLSVTKSLGVFKFNLEDMEIKIKGEQLVGNQKSRAKKKFRNW